MQRLKSKEDYEDFLKKTTGVAVIFFSAAWNGPSRGFTPKLQEISEEFDDVAFANVDVDENNAVATKEGVQMLPAFCYYKGGKKWFLGAGFISLQSVCARLLLYYRVLLRCGVFARGYYIVTGCSREAIRCGVFARGYYFVAGFSREAVTSLRDVCAKLLFIARCSCEVAAVT
ncbi:predicted protein [Nematostella vectensis]|uniref:Thioredoxin domain-containing protein n=1 Tax=Nematostella vectensis TaxID=45351 RepID=A7RT75_NEMVE|nr:predicted protein [Nematostella vectensis]|eukprot:XP_001637475.1 predicted protein [Nematostella vectensis]